MRESNVDYEGANDRYFFNTARLVSFDPHDRILELFDRQIKTIIVTVKIPTAELYDRLDRLDDSYPIMVVVHAEPIIEPEMVFLAGGFQIQIKK